MGGERVEIEKCLSCDGSKFRATKLEDNKLYGYILWKLQCLRCGESIEDKYTFSNFFV